MRKQPGARRHGRRRFGIVQKTFLGGCTAVVTIGGAVGCASDERDSRDVAPPITPTPSVTDAPNDGTPAPVIGPDGFAGLRLGMSAEEVRASGDAVLHGDVGGLCRTFTLAGDLPAADADSETDGFVSKEYGLVAVFARPGLSTPEGVGEGSTVAQLRAAYAAGDSEAGWFRVSLGGGREYEFGLGPGNIVESLSIRLIKQDCFG